MYVTMLAVGNTNDLNLRLIRSVRHSPSAYRRPIKRSRIQTQPRAFAKESDLEAANDPNPSLLQSLPGIAVFGASIAAAAAQSVLKKLFRRRRARHRASKRMHSTNGKAVFSVATFNLRGVMDRWAERAPVLKKCLEEMDSDVLCFQECLTGEYGQDRQLLDKGYHIFSCKAALFNLLEDNAVMRTYAKLCSSMLSVLPLQRLMVRIPAPLEHLRERFTLKNGVFRLMRDLAMAPFFGNSIACRLADAHEIKHSTLLLGDWRAAQRIEFAIGDGSDDVAQEEEGGSDSPRPRAIQSSNTEEVMKIWVVNTHLDHDHPDNRERQAYLLANWMDGVRNEAAAVILCGDFNGSPNEPFHQVLSAMGYRSAYKEKNGREPDGTWPSGIQAPLMDHGTFECLDYVYVWANEGYDIRVLDAQVYGNQPAGHDKTLYPSDHAAVKATLEVRKILAAVPSSNNTEAKL